MSSERLVIFRKQIYFSYLLEIMKQLEIMKVAGDTLGALTKKSGGVSAILNKQIIIETKKLNQNVLCSSMLLRLL